MDTTSHGLKERVGQQIPVCRQGHNTGCGKALSQNLLQPLGIWLDHNYRAGELTIVIDEAIKRDSIVMTLTCPSKTVANNGDEFWVKTRYRQQPVRKGAIEIGFRFKQQQLVSGNC